MKKDLYIIRGTGLSLDGAVVNIVEEVGDYVVVSPPNSPSIIQNTMVKKACLQPLNKGERHIYTFDIEKRTGNKTDSTTIQITNCIRDVDLSTIAEYIDTNLSPILRME